MSCHYFKNQKYWSLIIIFLVCVSFFVFFLPQKIDAAITVFDPWNFSVNSVTAKQTTLNVAGKEFALDALGWMAANVIIDKFADSLVAWIQSGFEGSPMFVTNLGGFLGGVGNNISGAFIDAYNLEFLCAPLGETNLDLSFFFPGTSRSKYNCTFSDVVENFKNRGTKININVNITQENIVREYQKDFRSGGWPMWLAMAQPQNNPHGRLLNAANDIYSQSEKKKEEERQNLQMGRGFLGVMACVRYRNSGSGKEECIEYKRTTPGSSVQNMLDKTLNKDVERLQVADEIDEIIGALASQLISWVVTGGSGGSGLLGYSSQADTRQRNITLQQKENREVLQRKADVIAETDDIRKWNSVYAEATEDQWGYLYDAKIRLEEIKNNLPSGSVIIVNNVSTEDQIRLIENEMALASTTAMAAAALDDKVSGLLREFNEKVLLASTKGEIDALKDKYCYSYIKSDGKGVVCETENLPSPQLPKVTKYESFGKKAAERMVVESNNVRQRMDDLITQYGGQ